MRIKQVLALVGAAAVSSLALAEPAPVAVSADGSTVTVYGNTSRLIHLTPGEAADATGSFKLQDGRTLRLTNRNSKMFMEVDGKREQLLPLSRTEFVAKNSGDRVEIDEQAFPENVQLTQFRR